MEFNPLANAASELQRQLDDLQVTKERITAELQRYGRFSSHAVTTAMHECEADAASLQSEIQSLDTARRDNDAQIAENEPLIGSLMNPYNWFAKDQRRLRRRCMEWREIGQQLSEQNQTKLVLLDNIRSQIAAYVAELQKHDSFDFPGHQSELQEVEHKIAGMTGELERVLEKKQEVDQQLAPVLMQIENIMAQIGQARSDIEIAQMYSRSLSGMPPRQRAKVHEQCEMTFGVRSPDILIGIREREIRKLQHDYDRTKRKAKYIGRATASTINTIIVDGTNLCYERDTFIGLPALESILPILSQNYSVVVVFNFAFTRPLEINDRALRDRLGEYAKVRFAMTRHEAEKLMLELAQDNHTYVLSNDRFVEYADKAAVRDDRVIRHEINDGNIFVYDLDIMAAFKQP